MMLSCFAWGTERISLVKHAPASPCAPESCCTMTKTVSLMDFDPWMKYPPACQACRFFELPPSRLHWVCPLSSNIRLQHCNYETPIRSKLRMEVTLCTIDIWRAKKMVSFDADDCITPDDVFEVLEEDMEEADLILWVGISFEQSASTSYFRKAREFLLRAGRWQSCTQALINLSEDAHFNLLSACNNIGQLLYSSIMHHWLLVHTARRSIVFLHNACMIGCPLPFEAFYKETWSSFASQTAACNLE